MPDRKTWSVPSVICSTAKLVRRFTSIVLLCHLLRKDLLVTECFYSYLGAATN